MELKRYKLGEIGEIRMCKRILKEETNSVGGVPFFKIGTFGGQADVFITKEKFEEYKNAYSYPKKGDVLISAAGTIGRTVVFDGKDAYFQDSNIVWIENDESKVLNEYLFYCYKNIRWTTSVGSTILRLYNDDIRNTDIIVPPLSEQKKIASVLSTLDDKIALNKKMNQKLEAMAKRLYDYWFVQFDFPDKNGLPYKTAGGPMTYNLALKREIPEGWKQSSILLKNIYNSDFTANGSFNDLAENVKYNDGSPYALLIRIVDLNDDFAKSEKFIWVNKHSYDYLKTSSLHGGEIIICNVGNAGAVYRCPFLNCPMTLGPNGVVVNDVFYNNYLYMYFKSELGQQQLRSISSGSIQLKFNKTSFRNIPLLFPDDKTLSLFNEKYNSIYAQINNLWMENRKLVALRDKLLPLLMNCQVMVG